MLKLQIMFIAQQLKKQNIVEYLLYMWQIEDLIRALGLDMEKIKQQIIEPYKLSDEDKTKLYEWYESLIDMMCAENAQVSGHIQLNKNVIIQLDDFHHEMLKSGQDAIYTAKFHKVLPALAQLRQKQSDDEISDIELGFNFLYGIMTLRMNKKEISPDTLNVQADVTDFLTTLNRDYQLYLGGDLTFED
ncbi:MAG: DUF4924 family protein [Paludibacteraceae bacterium]